MTLRGCGYDSDTSEFIVLDHVHVNGLQFVERRIGYEECMYCIQKHSDVFNGEQCISVLSKTSCEYNIVKEFDSISGNKEKFWKNVEKTIKSFHSECFEKLFELFGNYERLLRALQYVNEVDYSDEIKYTSLIKMLFGKAARYMMISDKNKELILNSFAKISII